MSVAEATKRADVLLIELADPVQPGVYKAEIAPHLRPGMTLCFCHWFSVLYGQIVLAISKAVGSTRAGVVEMTFQHETEGDNFE